MHHKNYFSAFINFALYSIRIMKDNSILNKETSIGGILGALAGTAASSKFHKEQDRPIRKAAKTGLFAAAGYFLGSLVEHVIRKK